MEPAVQSLSKLLRAVALPVGLLAVVSGCTVFETTALSPIEGVACRSTAGAYFLPRTLVRVKVVANAIGRGFKVDRDQPEFTTVADFRHQPYCLDYLASPTSKDVIAVKRAANGLLQEVFSNVIDRSAEIAITLAKTGALFAQAGARTSILGAAAGEAPPDLMFDPFDPLELTEINRALRRFGLCVYIENHSFPDGAINPQAWCSDPHQERYVNQLNILLATTPARPEAMTTGILYRPNITHKLVVRRKSDPTGREPWSLYITKHMEMPNVSPIFAIGVHRAIFTNRETSLTFANGVLTNVRIDKGSELEAFSRIPLEIAQVIVKLPTEIIQLRIDDTRGQAELASAQTTLITTLAELNKTTMNNPGAVATMGLPVGEIPDKLKQLFDHCLQLGGAPDFCKAKIMGTAPQ